MGSPLDTALYPGGSPLLFSLLTSLFRLYIASLSLNHGASLLRLTKWPEPPFSPEACRQGEDAAFVVALRPRRPHPVVSALRPAQGVPRLRQGGCSHSLMAQTPARASSGG